MVLKPTDQFLEFMHHNMHLIVRRLPHSRSLLKRRIILLPSHSGIKVTTFVINL